SRSQARLRSGSSNLSTAIAARRRIFSNVPSANGIWFPSTVLERTLMTAVFSIVLLVALALWAGTVGTLATLNDSDTAGNAMSQAFGVFFTIGLWILLAVLMIIAAVKGQMPSWTKLAALFLLPASGIAALVAGDLLKDRLDSPARWPIVVVA